MAASVPILVAAINARHSHASMGARCLLANLGELRPQAALAEFTIQQSAAEIAAEIAARAPKILGLGAYVWNAARVVELLPLLRRQAPQTKIVLGGPEITEATAGADVLLFGEGDFRAEVWCDGRQAASAQSAGDLPGP